MNKTVKNTFIVLMVFFTGFVMLACLGVGIYSQNEIYYDVVYGEPMDIVDVEVEKIGKIFGNEESRENMTYYKLDVLLKNNTNVSAQESSTSFCYELENGYVETIYNNRFFSTGQYLIPAGEQGKVACLVQIPDDAKTLKVYMWDDTDERYEIDLQ